MQGYIVPEYFKWPGYLSPSMGIKFADVPNGLAAITKATELLSMQTRCYMSSNIVFLHNNRL